jgi:hypothetical protein
MMAAKATGINELEIDNEEAKLMSDAVAEVASHYNYVVDPKTMAWVGFIGVMGSIYGPRIAVYQMRKSMEKASKPAPAKQSADVVGIVSGNAPINFGTM